ncbi:hypothetical protein Klosneuvirus_3_12 [Klosneuvirus KNV1]|uniref:Uncharacterized protein n=1 Tax=Klosneuvirus KNV1 TaxID=1977640 RepID=A0A1V0SJH5_9VIRU|nr:hypothetical protein Klosneuvirus_3_12 [Klosneuvirus KNV1]
MSSETTMALENNEDLCEQFLKDNNVVYKRNIHVMENKIQFMEIDFIIPGAIIEIKTGTSLPVNRIIKQLQRYIEYVPGSFTIYLYSHQIFDTDDLHRIQFDPRIKLIRQFTEIAISNIDCFIFDVTAVRSFGSKLNNKYEYFLNKYKKNNIIIPKKVYDIATVIMTQTELDRLHKFNIMINDTIPQSINLIHHKISYGTPYLEYFTKSQYNRLFYLFFDKCNVYGLESWLPTKCISGVSDICKTCNKIYFIKYLQNEKCVNCMDNNSSKSFKRKFTEIQAKEDKEDKDSRPNKKGRIISLTPKMFVFNKIES